MPLRTKEKNKIMKTFREFLQEAPVALFGDWEPQRTLEHKTEHIINTKWREMLGSIEIRNQTIKLRKLWARLSHSGFCCGCGRCSR